MSVSNPATSLYDLCEHCGHLYKVHFDSKCGHLHHDADENLPLGQCSCPGFSKKQELMLNPCAEIDLGTGLPVEIDVPEMPFPEAPEGVQGVVDPETGVTTIPFPTDASMTFEPKALSWEQDLARMCICGHTKGRHTQILTHEDGKVTGGICCATASTKDYSYCPSKCQKFTEVVTLVIETDPNGAAKMAALKDNAPIVLMNQGPNAGKYKHLIMDDVVGFGKTTSGKPPLTKDIHKSVMFGLGYGKSLTMSDLDYGMFHDEMYLYNKKPKILEHSEGQLEGVANWLWKAGGIKKTFIQGHDLRDICIAYAAEAMREMTENFDSNVEKAVQKRMAFEKKQHKDKCIPSYKKNGRKFRDDNG